jgi:hypothetical protein
MTRFVFGSGLRRVRILCPRSVEPILRDADEMLRFLHELELSDGDIVEVATQWGFWGGDARDAASLLLQRYLCGDLAFNAEYDAWPRLGRGTLRDDHDDFDGPIVPLREPTFVALSVVHETGATYPGLRLNVALPDGELRTVTLDARSSVRIEDITDAGICHVRAFRDGLALTPERKAAAGPAITRRGDDIVTRSDTKDSLSLRTGLEHRIVVEDPALARYEVRVVDEVGVALDGVPLAMELGKNDHPVATDADGHAELDAPDIGLARVRFADVDVVRELLRDRWAEPREDPWLTERDDHDYVTWADPSPVVEVAAGRPHTIVVQPRVVCARLLQMLFETDKTFLLPTVFEHIRSIRQLYEEMPGATILIVGHTDATGDPSVNDPLSLRRAESVRAFLCDDVDAWLDNYAPSVPVARRWGAAEDQLILQTVLAESGEEVTDIPVRHFQTTRGLEPDGDLGPITRRKIVEEYMAVDGTSLPEGVEAIVHGCGENFPAEVIDPSVPEDPSAQPAAPPSDPEQTLDRRVELFFFDGEIGVHPPPPGDNSPAGSPVYPHWRRLARETHDFVVRTNTITVRVLLGATDSDGSPEQDRPERLRLRTADGSYDRVMRYDDAIRVSMHHFAVEFEHVPLGAECMYPPLRSPRTRHVRRTRRADRRRGRTTRVQRRRRLPRDPTSPRPTIHRGRRRPSLATRSHRRLLVLGIGKSSRAVLLVRRLERQDSRDADRRLENAVQRHPSRRPRRRAHRPNHRCIEACARRDRPLGLCRGEWTPLLRNHT